MDLKRYEVRGLYSGTMVESPDGAYSRYLEAIEIITKLTTKNKKLKEENNALHSECDRLTAIIADIQPKPREEQ